MPSAEEMLKRIQVHQRKSGVFKAIFNADGAQLDFRNVSTSDLQAQMSVETATWALSVYEAELGIPTDESKPYSERRAVIKAKMRGTGKVDRALIKATVDSWTNGEVAVTFDSSTITITFTSIVGIPSNIDDVQLAVEEIKPAHLAILYVYLYNRYQQLAAYTHNQLATRTYEQLRSSVLP